MSDEKGKFWKQITHKKNGDLILPEEYHEEEVEPFGDTAPEKIAKVTVKYGRTISLGDFNTARIDVGVELPTGVEELNEAYEAAEEFIGPKYVSAVNSVIRKRSIKNTGSGVDSEVKNEED